MLVARSFIPGLTTGARYRIITLRKVCVNRCLECLNEVIMIGRTAKQVLTVEGMSCSHCEQRIEKSVGALEHIRKVKASHKNQAVEIRYGKSDTLDLARVKETISELGFDVK